MLSKLRVGQRSRAHTIESREFPGRFTDMGFRVGGGDKLLHYVRDVNVARRKPRVMELGYKGTLSHWSTRTNSAYRTGTRSMPERSAFRNALFAMQKAAAAKARRIAVSRRPFNSFTDADAVQIGRAALHEQRESYLNFQGTPLSELQTARKAGTPYADRQLVGGEGPKMIEHLSVWVDGKQVA